MSIPRPKSPSALKRIALAAALALPLIRVAHAISALILATLRDTLLARELASAVASTCLKLGGTIHEGASVSHDVVWESGDDVVGGFGDSRACGRGGEEESENGLELHFEESWWERLIV